METRAAAAGKKSESRMDKMENCMVAFRSELNQIGSQLDQLSQLDVDRLNNIVDRLLKVEESIISLVRHLEAGTLHSTSSIPTPGKAVIEDLLPECEALRSGKDKIGDPEATMSTKFARPDQ